MTIAELAWTVAWVAGAAAGIDTSRLSRLVQQLRDSQAEVAPTKPIAPWAGLSPAERERYWANERAKLRHKLLTTEPTWNEDPIDGALRKIYRGEYNQRSWEE